MSDLQMDKRFNRRVLKIQRAIIDIQRLLNSTDDQVFLNLNHNDIKLHVFWNVYY